MTRAASSLNQTNNNTNGKALSKSNNLGREYMSINLKSNIKAQSSSLQPRSSKQHLDRDAKGSLGPMTNELFQSISKKTSSNYQNTAVAMGQIFDSGSSEIHIPIIYSQEMQ